MDPHFIKYYNQELNYMRNKAKEFAEAHPKVAGRLGMVGMEVKDPYVEQLLEAFSFMSARMHIKLDAEFPKFTQQLLQVLYPNFISPTPAMSIAQIYPTMDSGSLNNQVSLPKNSVLKGQVNDGSTLVPCTFRNSLEIPLWPLEILDVQLTDEPYEIKNLSSHLPPNTVVKGALRITLNNFSNKTLMSDLEGLDELTFHLSGDEQTASQLYELIMTSAVATCVTTYLSETPDDKPSRGASIVTDSVEVVGFEPDQNLLPLGWQNFHGHNLLQTYFACPEVFNFFKLKHLAPLFSKTFDKKIELIVLLSKPSKELKQLVRKETLSLFCSPIINLFNITSSWKNPGLTKHTLHCQASNEQPRNHEIFSVEALITGLESSTDVKVQDTFRPLYATINQDQRNYGRYFTVLRENRTLSDQERKYGVRSSYIGTEVFAKLVDQDHIPFEGDYNQIQVECLSTNRDLPILFVRNGITDLTTELSLPIGSIGLKQTFSQPRNPLAERDISWRLIRMLGFNYYPLLNLRPAEAIQTIKNILTMFVRDDDQAHHLQIESLTGLELSPTTQRLPNSGIMTYGRGIKAKLTVNEKGFSGKSAIQLACCIEQWLSSHVTINSFISFELHSIQRGKIHQWPTRFGRRGAI